MPGPTRGDEQLSVGAAFAAGLLAGGIFLSLEVATAFAFGAGSPYGPAHVTLQGFFGTGEAPGDLTWGLASAVLFIHLFLSVLMTTILAMFTHRQSMDVAVGAGALFGAMLYFGNFYLLTLPAPALLAARGLFMLVNYVVFGVLATWSYKRLARHFARRPYR